MTVTPYTLTMVELTFVQGRSNKFYRGYVDHQTFEVRYQFGRNGYWNEGAFTDPKTFESFAAANEAMFAQIQKKIRKGYQVQRSLTITCAKQPPLSLLAREVNRPLYQRDDALGTSSLVIANV